MERKYERTFFLVWKPSSKGCVRIRHGPALWVQS